jgi:hypothetical protein
VGCSTEGAAAAAQTDTDTAVGVKWHSCTLHVSLYRRQPVTNIQQHMSLEQCVLVCHSTCSAPIMQKP